MLVKQKFAVFPGKTAGNRRDPKIRTRVDDCGTKPGFALLTQALFSVNVALRVRQRHEQQSKKRIFHIRGKLRALGQKRYRQQTHQGPENLITVSCEAKALTAIFG